MTKKMKGKDGNGKPKKRLRKVLSTKGMVDKIEGASVVHQEIGARFLRQTGAEVLGINGHRRHIVKVQMTEGQKARHQQLELDSYPGSLKKINEMRKCALDPALVGLEEASPKYDKLVEMLSAHDDGTPAVVLSSVFKSGVLGKLCKRLEDEGFRVARIDGDPERRGKKREMILAGFQDGEYDVLVATKAVVGKGANLTAAHRVYFIDVPFRERDITQVMARIDKKGQKSSTVDLYVLVSEGSIDERILQLVEEEKRISAHIRGKLRDALWRIVKLIKLTKPLRPIPLK